MTDKQQREDLVRVYLAVFSSNPATFPSNTRIKEDLEMLNKFIDGDNKTTPSNK